mgnify:CR=1 FL=1
MAGMPSFKIGRLGFKHFENYVNQNGTAQIKQKYQTAEGYNLGSWVNTQITNFNKGKILHEREKRLDAIGFIWNAKK